MALDTSTPPELASLNQRIAHIAAEREPLRRRIDREGEKVKAKKQLKKRAELANFIVNPRIPNTRPVPNTPYGPRQPG